jgi:hypothetical protein
VPWSYSGPFELLAKTKREMAALSPAEIQAQLAKVKSGETKVQRERSKFEYLWKSRCFSDLVYIRGTMLEHGGYASEQIMAALDSRCLVLEQRRRPSSVGATSSSASRCRTPRSRTGATR